MSIPVTSAPVRASGIAVVPSPQPRSKTRSGGAIPSDSTTTSPDWRMKAAISVKSPFSHNALFGFIISPLLFPSGLQLCNAPTDTSMPERRHNLLGRLSEADCFAGRPRDFAGNPEDRMDAFSDILSGVKLH